MHNSSTVYFIGGPFDLTKRVFDFLIPDYIRVAIYNPVFAYEQNLISSYMPIQYAEYYVNKLYIKSLIGNDILIATFNEYIKDEPCKVCGEFCKDAYDCFRKRTRKGKEKLVNTIDSILT